mgnify:CR=1 FL=1
MKQTLILLITLFFCSLLLAQKDSLKRDPDKESIPKLVFSDLKTTASTVLFAYKRPFQWKKKQWIQFGAVVGLTFATALIDERTDRFFQTHQSRFLEGLSSVGDRLGRPANNVPFYIGLYGAGVLTKNEWIRNTSTMIFASLAISGFVQTLTKDAVGRARPDANLGNTAFKAFGGRAYHSFPSGHALLSISTTWVLARQLKPLPLKILFYAIPTVVSWSRIYDGAHWLSDVVLGNALGIAAAETVLKYFPKIKNNNGSLKGLTILPGRNGLQLTYRF